MATQALAFYDDVLDFISKQHLSGTTEKFIRSNLKQAKIHADRIKNLYTFDDEEINEVLANGSDLLWFLHDCLDRITYELTTKKPYWGKT